MLLAACTTSTSSNDLPTSTPGSTVAGTTVPSPSTRPNIIVVMTDDQTVAQLSVMPKVKQLMTDKGISFSNFVVNTSECCPSRTTWLTGLQSRHHGVLWNVPPTGGFASFKNQELTLPVALQQVGYHTVMIGKYLNRYGERDPEDRYVPPGWSDFKGLIWPAESIYYGNSFYDNGQVLTLDPDEYVTSAITRLTVAAIDQSVEAGDPFFMMIGHVAPHAPGGLTLEEASKGQVLKQILERYPDGFVPAVPEPKYEGAADGVPLPGGPSFNEADISDKPKTTQRKPLDGQTIGKIEVLYRRALETLMSVDDSVSTMIDELDRRGVLENTYIFFTSDNGAFYGEHRYPYGKYYMYRTSRTVPLIVTGPGVPAGVVQPSVVSNLDMAPTIAELTGATLPRVPDGVSLVDMLRDGSVRKGRAIYLEGHAPDEKLVLPFDGVYTGRLLYIEHTNGEAELYDVQKDPDELDNLLAGNPPVDDVEQAMALLRVLRSCAGVTCQTIGSDLPVPSSGPEP